MVGVQGFEPWTPCSQSRCATGLRHTPNLIWWRVTGSNRRPPACKTGALPIELTPQICCWCEWWDSNPHAEARDFKSLVYTDSTTLALLLRFVFVLGTRLSLPIALVALFCLGHLPQERTAFMSIFDLTCQAFVLLAHLVTTGLSCHNLSVVKWCPRRDSNSHTFRRQILSLVRLPFRHRGFDPLLQITV